MVLISLVYLGCGIIHPAWSVFFFFFLNCFWERSWAPNSGKCRKKSWFISTTGMGVGGKSALFFFAVNEASTASHFFFQLLCTLTTLRLLSRQKSWWQVSSFLLPRFLPSIFIAHYHTGFIQRSRSSSIFWRVLLTQAFALSAKVNSCTRKNLYEYSRVCTRRASFYLFPPTDLAGIKPDACYDRELHHFFSEVFSIWELEISPTQKLIRRKLKLVPGEKFHGLLIDTQREWCEN